MGDVLADLPHAGQQALDPLQHGVEVLRETVELVAVPVRTMRRPNSPAMIWAVERLIRSRRVSIQRLRIRPPRSPSTMMAPMPMKIAALICCSPLREVVHVAADQQAIAGFVGEHLGLGGM